MYGAWKGCEQLALWNKNDREYDGANSHSCMHERRSLEDVRPEEIAQLLQQRAERNKKKSKEWSEDHKEERRTQKRAWDEENKDHVNEYGRERAKKARDSAQHSCKVCHAPFANPRELNRHLDSEVACKPKRDAARTARLTCGGCKQVFSQMGNLERHHTMNQCQANRTLEDMSCPTCGRVIKNKGNMERHIATHK
jgi:hypothetical protein